MFNVRVFPDPPHVLAIGVPSITSQEVGDLHSAVSPGLASHLRDPCPEAFFVLLLPFPLRILVLR
jgi:hypothetical protein